eukprot:365205-Chlamydomonas_euryale.AAC.20
MALMLRAAAAPRAPSAARLHVAAGCESSARACGAAAQGAGAATAQTTAPATAGVPLRQLWWPFSTLGEGVGVPPAPGASTAAALHGARHMSLAALQSCPPQGAWHMSLAALQPCPQQQCRMLTTSSRSASSAHGHAGDGDGGSAGPSGREPVDPAADTLRGRLLDAALGHVAAYGWTHGALVTAARELGLSPAVVGLLPRCEGQLVEHELRRCNARLVQLLHERSAAAGADKHAGTHAGEHACRDGNKGGHGDGDGGAAGDGATASEGSAAGEASAGSGLRTRLVAALRARLEMVAPHVDSWPQALAIATQPSNLPSSTTLLGEMVDDVWHAVGDASADASWYSKRAMLAGVYLSTELYMLTDASPGRADTWAALDRRVGDMLAAGDAAAGLGELPAKIVAGLRAQVGGTAQARP